MREQGLYWVQTAGDWKIALWMSGRWFSASWCAQVGDAGPEAVIESPIVPPDEIGDPIVCVHCKQHLSGPPEGYFCCDYGYRL